MSFLKKIHNPVLRIAPEGDYICLTNDLIEEEVKVDNLPYDVQDRSKKENSKRAGITTFTKKSRGRLCSLVAKIKRHSRPVFVTLTYPENYPSDYKKYKRDLSNFSKRLKYAFPGVSVLWKLEFQDRGAPHYHMFVFGASLSRLQAFIPLAWYQVVKSGDEKHLRWHRGELGNGNEHCVQEIRSWNGVKSYTAKYFTKGVNVVSETGRFWGYWGDLPLSTILEFSFTMEEALRFKNDIQLYTMYLHDNFGFWMYGEKYYEWVFTWLSEVESVPESPPVWWECDINRFYDLEDELFPLSNIIYNGIG